MCAQKCCVEEHSLDSSRLVCMHDDRRCPSDDWAEGRRFAAGAPRWGRRTHPAHTQDAQSIIHKEALCTKSVNLVDVMSVVVNVINSILSRSLHHRQFQALVDEVNVQYGDLLYFCESRSHAVPCVRPAEGDRHIRPAMARSPSPADGHDYAPECPQREASGQRHSRNKHARTHRRLRGKAAIVVGAIG